MRLTLSYVVVIGSSGSLLSAARPAPGVTHTPSKNDKTPPIVTELSNSSLQLRFGLARTMLARGAFELASTSRYGAAAVLFRSGHVLSRHVHGSGAAFDLRTDG